MNIKHYTISLGLIALANSSLAFWGSETSTISIHTSLVNLNDYSDLLLIREDFWGDKYLLSLVPRSSTWFYDTSAKVYFVGDDSYTKTYKLQWSVSPSSSFTVKQSFSTQDGLVSRASCYVSDPTMGVCDYSYYGNEVDFFITAR